MSQPPASKRVEPSAWVHQVSTSVTPFVGNTTITDADRVGFGGLNDHQWKTLVRVLNERNTGDHDRFSGKFFLESWIIDSGSSHHMTCNIESIMDVCDMPPVFIKLPDGRFTTAHMKGTVYLGSQLQLLNVFFVDGLQCHLIYVLQLTQDRRCLFQISDLLCIIQDCITVAVIGAGRQQHRLYLFCGCEAVASVQQFDKLPRELWHCLLGHPAMKEMEMLKISDFSSTGFDNKSSDICIRSKQTRNSFPLSNNKTSSAFDLIHCDLWGPYRTTSICGSRYFLTIIDDYSRAL